MSGLFRPPNIEDLKKKKKVAQLIRALNHKDQRIRTKAALALGELHDSSALEPLLEGLNHRPNNTVEFMKAIGELGDRRAVRALMPFLNHEQLRPFATEALARLVDQDAVDPLMAALRNPDCSVKKSAVVLLGKTHDRRVVPVLVALLEDRNPSFDFFFVKEAAVKALSEVGDIRAIEPLLMIVRSEGRQLKDEARESLKAIAKAVPVEPFLAAASDPDPEIRKVAAYGLGQHDDLRARQALVALALNDIGASSEAFDVLMHRGTEYSDALRAGLSNKGYANRLPGIGLVPRLVGDRAAETLISLLDEDDPRLRKEAFRELGKLKDQRVPDLILEAMQQSELRVAAIQASENFDDRRFLQPLIAALYDQDETIRLHAGGSLDRLIPRVLAQGDKLAKIDYPEGSKIEFVIRGLLEHPLEEEQIIEALDDRSEFVRAKAAMLMRRWNNRRARKALISKLEDPSSLVREQVVESLGEIGDQSVVMALKKVAADDPYQGALEWNIVRAGARIHDEWQEYGYPIRKAAEAALKKIEGRRRFRQQ